MIHTPTANAPLPPVSLSQQTVLRREDPWKATSFSGMEASPSNTLKGHNGSCHSPPNVSFKLLFTPHTLLCALPSNACWFQGPQITSDAFEMTKQRLQRWSRHQGHTGWKQEPGSPGSRCLDTGNHCILLLTENGACAQHCSHHRAGAKKVPHPLLQ